MGDEESSVPLLSVWSTEDDLASPEHDAIKTTSPKTLNYMWRSPPSPPQQPSLNHHLLWSTSAKPQLIAPNTPLASHHTGGKQGATCVHHQAVTLLPQLREKVQAREAARECERSGGTGGTQQLFSPGSHITHPCARCWPLRGEETLPAAESRCLCRSVSSSAALSGSSGGAEARHSELHRQEHVRCSSK